MCRPMRNALDARALAALTLALAGCTPGPFADCEPGRTIACVPDGGGTGDQSCGPDGRYGPCIPRPRSDASLEIVEPVLPAPPEWECPAGWGRRTVFGASVCDPWPAGVPTCEPPLRRVPGSAACVPLGEACPTGALPDVTPAGALHVVADAVGGDGSRAAPFGTIAAALAVVPMGGTVIVGRGSYAEAFAIPAGVTVRGACVAETRIETALMGTTLAAVRTSAVGARLEALSIITDRDVGVAVSPTASMSIRDVWIDGADTAIVAFGDSLDAEDVLVTGARAIGAQIGTNTRVGLTRVSFEGAHSTGIDMRTGADVTLEDVVVSDIDDTGASNAILVEGDGAMLHARRLVVEAVAGAYLTSQAGPTVTIEDSVFLDPRGVSNTGISAYDRTALTLRRTWLDGLRTLAVGAGNAGTTLSLEDVVIARTRPTTPSSISAGIEVVDGAAGTIRRVAVVDVAGIGLLVDGAGTRLDAEDLEVRELRGGPAGTFGRGVHAQQAAVVTLSRASVSYAREVGIAASTGARVEARELTVLRTLERECGATTCAEAPAGMGIAAIGGSVDLERFEVTASRLCGVQIATGGEVDARLGVVRGNRIGLCLQVAGYDADRLTDGVVYLENERSIDSIELPVPDAFVPRASP